MPWRPNDLFPLGQRPASPGEDVPASAGPARPFGLRYLTDPDPGSAVALDWEKVSYDPDRQIAVISGDQGVMPMFRHTSSKTSTSTNIDDREASDSDEDTEQDVQPDK